ncbi:MAG: hypothetical protein KGI27_11080 [Thaumarchaeota archaeon]|nr:hypothetical protein [Nitrososphaerota archaeon]
MKALYMTIITGLGIAGTVVVALVFASFWPNPSGSNMALDGIDLQYKAGDMVQPVLRFSNQSQGCNTPKITLLNATNRSQAIYNVTAKYVTCNNHFGTDFYAGVNEDWIINHPQKYVIVGSVGSKSVEKEFLVYPNPDHPKLYTDIQVVGPHAYLADHPMNFTIWVKAYGIVNGGEEPDVTIYNNTGSKIWQTHVGVILCCVPELGQINRNFTSSELGNEEGQINGPPVMEKPGEYAMTVSYNKKTISERFTVLSYSNFLLPYNKEINVTHSDGTFSGFTINYTISGDGNKLLAAKIDTSKSLTLSLATPNNGTLAVIVPRALIDSKNAYDNQDAQFIVLMDGKEVKYTEIKSITARIITIPFTDGAEKIEIIAPASI